MKLIEEYKFSLPSSYYSFNKELKPFGYFDIFQSMASMHASKLNVGFDDLMKNNITWVLARVKFEKVSKIYQDLPLVGKTWPHPHNRFDSVRDYLIFDDKGNVLAKGSSLWCLINFKTGRLLPTNSAPIEGDFVEDSVYENKLEKINYDETLLESLSTYRVVLSDIDCNQHMNNAKYAELVYNLLTKEESELLNSMEINYLQQAFLGDELSLKGYRILNEIIILGYKGDAVCFIAKCIL